MEENKKTEKPKHSIWDNNVIKDTIIINGGSKSKSFADIYHSLEMHGKEVFQEIIYDNCEFKLPVRFDETKFNDTITFKNCIFHQDCEFNCDINYISFENVIFKDNFKFDSPIENLCKFKKVTFESYLVFYTYSVKDKKIEFTSCNFDKIAYFRNLNFGNDVLFNRCDLTNCSFLYSYIEYIRFQDCEFDFKNLIDEKNLAIPKPEFTKKDIITLYRHFEINLDKYKDYDTSGEFHKKRLELDRETQNLNLRKIILTFYKWSSNYGENYAKPIVFFGITLAVFTFLYLISGVSYGGGEINWLTCKGFIWYDDIGTSFLYSLNNSVPFRKELEHIKPVNGLTSFFSIVQTFLQTILGTLFIIALRRKFRR